MNTEVTAMEDLLRSVRVDFGPQSPAFDVVATALGEIVQELTRLTLSGELPRDKLEGIRSLRDRFEQALDSLWPTDDVNEPPSEETQGGSAKRTSGETAKIVTEVRAPQELKSNSDPLAAPVQGRTVFSGQKDNLRRLWQETSEQAKQQGYANQEEPADNPGELWRALHLLYLRLPASDAAEQRLAAARAARLEVRTRDVVIPEFAGCSELDFGSSGSSGPASPVYEQQKLIIKSCGEVAWERHQALLGPLAKVLTLLEMDDRYLQLPLWQIYRKPDLNVDARTHKKDFRDRVTERLERLKKHTVDAAVPGNEELDALVAVLETVRAVTYQLMPALDSWWAENAETADDYVGDKFKRTGIGKFKVVKGSQTFGKLALTNPKQDIPLNHPTWSKTPNQVLWMLRPYIELSEGEEGRQLGRVIYARTR